MQLRTLAGMSVVAAAAVGAVAFLFSGDSPPPGLRNAEELERLPANRWTLLHEESGRGWRRQGHAGIAFDRRRGTLLIFGSDTHGEDWDNTVHEFDPLRREWRHHYREAPPETYRGDAEGRRVAGEGGAFPWAMHTYDGIEYDPARDALVVAARVDHNPRAREVPEAKWDPTWLYDLGARRWRALEPGGVETLAFGTAITYDAARDVLVGCASRVWELGPARGRWESTGVRCRGGFHHVLAYNPRDGRSYVFGSYTGTSEVGVYTPALFAGGEGRWEVRTPGGAAVTPYSGSPAAFDEDQGLALVVPIAPRAKGGQGEPGLAKTFVYDPMANEYREIIGAEVPVRGMNYMMVWDPLRRVFLLVTQGRGGKGVAVWGLRLKEAVGVRS